MPLFNAETIYPLIDYLDQCKPNAATDWQNWYIKPILGGRNNKLYRAINPPYDIAVKFTIRDDRDRAGREYHTLQALEKAGFTIAPRSIFMDRDRYSQPVVVQTWAEGIVKETPPQTDADWLMCLQHYATMHTVTPEMTTEPLLPAIANVDNTEAGIAYVRELSSFVPRGKYMNLMTDLINRLENTSFPEWEPPHKTLCRVDQTPRNFLRGETEWWSVDWEYAGWGDPATDITELITHPEYLNITDDRWNWVIETYADLVNNPDVIIRIQTYRTILTVNWVARFSRIVAGADRKDRIAVESPTQREMEMKYEHYVRLANVLM